jgi:D-alanyl-D-alanine carboxypeptidase (penicillin-binding protein 5/6)
MLDRSGPCIPARRFSRRTALAAAGAVLAGSAVAAPAAAAASPSPSPSPSPPPSGSPAVIGGPQLSGRGVIVNYPAGRVLRLPGVKASAWVIADAGTGQVLAAKDPHGWYRPASTLKVLTAVSLIPVLNPNAMVTATKQATTVEPNLVGLLPGHAYKVSDLFTALLTISANDAAVALTQATGSYARGMAVINAAARHLQADDTVAVTPNGLDARGQHVSAYDLALFARQALPMPAFLKYDRTTGGLFRISKKKSVGLWNQNTLLTTYKGAIGGKIGWTSAAGATYVGMARRHGVTLIVALLHCPALTEIDAGKSLLNWGFAVDGKVRPVGTLVGARPPAAPAGSPSPSLSPSLSPSPPPSRHRDAAARATRSRTVTSEPSALATAGFSGVAVVVAGVGFACTRRRRRHP